MPEKKKVLMVCLGNICRSPIAEAVFNEQVKKLNLQDKWVSDSAALIDYHLGKDPDRRASHILRQHGINDYKHKVRVINENDFHKFDWIFGMDNYIIQELSSMQPNDTPAKVELLGKYDPQGEVIIRDPYYDADDAGFEKAYQQCVRSIEEFLKINIGDIYGTTYLKLTTTMTQKKKVLMVCLGNTCRSPIAEAVFNEQIKKLDMQGNWETDSAALIDYHVGKDPNNRALHILRLHGINDYKHKARLINENDFHKFDWIFGMDSYILHQLYSMQPDNSLAKVELLGKYDPHGEVIIRDPYFDTDDTGFEKAYQQSVRSIEEFLKLNIDTLRNTL